MKTITFCTKLLLILSCVLEYWVKITSLFCSEFYIVTYTTVGLLSQHIRELFLIDTKTSTVFLHSLKNKRVTVPLLDKHVGGGAGVTRGDNVSWEQKTVWLPTAHVIISTSTLLVCLKKIGFIQTFLYVDMYQLLVHQFTSTDVYNNNKYNFFIQLRNLLKMIYKLLINKLKNKWHTGHMHQYMCKIHNNSPDAHTVQPSQTLVLQLQETCW